MAAKKQSAEELLKDLGQKKERTSKKLAAAIEKSAEAPKVRDARKKLKRAGRKLTKAAALIESRKSKKVEAAEESAAG